MKIMNQLFKNVVLVALIGLISVQTYAQTVTSTYYHTDALGSIVAASDEQGGIIWKKTYDPYGNEVLSTEDGDEFEGQAYTGKPFDKETGLVYLGQRYYDPEIKRFMGMDPVGFRANAPVSFNRYAYANNNPYKFVDPDGTSALTAFGGAIHESYSFLSGDGFDGANVYGALTDGYNGEGSGLGVALFEDATSFVPLGSAIKVFRLAKLKLGANATKELGGRLFTSSNGIGTLGSLKILQRGDNIIFDDFTVGTARGMLGAGQKGAAELVGPLKELLRFSQQNGAKTITLNGKFVTDEGAALGRGVVGDSFSFSFPATQEGLKTFLGGLR